MAATLTQSAPTDLESRPLSILDLGEDIFTFHLIKHLKDEDVVSLFLTCKQLYQSLNNSIVWQELLNNTFANHSQRYPIPLQLQMKWPSLYSMRKNAQLFTWGSNESSRLGTPYVPETNYEMVPGLRIPKRMKSAYQLKLTTDMSNRTTNFRGCFQTTGDVDCAGCRDNQRADIIDISGGGFSFQILTSLGELYYTGKSYMGTLDHAAPGPQREEILESTNYQSRSSRMNGIPLQFQNMNTMNRVVTSDSDYGEAHFVEMSSGRSHFIALDENRKDVWTWDDKRQSKKGVKLNLINPVSRVSLINDENRICKIRAGWGLSSCLIRNVGIVVWNTRSGINHQQGAKCVFGPVDSSVTIIENTNQDRIADYVVLSGYIVYITYSGELFKVEIKNDDVGVRSYIPNGVKLNEFHKFADKHSSSQLPSSSSFVRVFGDNNKFAVTTNNDQVLFGNVCDEACHPLIYPELQHQSIVSISMGDHHYMALNSQGEVFSWGKELRTNGCLGNLGLLDDIMKSGVGHLEDNNATLVIERPTKIGLPNDNGVVLGIAAGGWHSAALVGC
ncbi:unnamed protein product [Ambrosiozyma monospora]|uniref:Unnamed protein product n=1 Tax=Ambrosiozyma monospora TaxID=43982 RepID=A0A9W7DDW4_AMBMO|nr:unnamed protein product [Ambrosiozyma monospora]